MNIKVRKNAVYVEYAFNDGQTKVESGLLNKWEALEAASQFASAADDLLRFDNDLLNGYAIQKQFECLLALIEEEQKRED